MNGEYMNWYKQEIKIDIDWNENTSLVPITHVLGDEYISQIMHYSQDAFYENLLVKKISKIYSLLAYFLLIFGVYYYYTNDSHAYKMLQNIINVIVGFMIINLTCSVAEKLTSLICRKIFLKKHIEYTNNRRFIFLSNKQNQYNLIKSLAYLQTPEEGTDPHYIKENFLNNRKQMLLYLKLESYDNFIKTYLDAYRHSKKHIAYLSDIECDDAYYLELKNMNLENKP